MTEAPAPPPADAAEDVEVWFSFRSPYSWLALHRIARLVARAPADAPALAGVPVRLRFAAVFPADASRVAASASPERLRYTVEDFARIAAAYGLRPAPPLGLDTDWMRPSAAFHAADAAGAALPFALAVFAARFGERREPASDEVIAGAARAAGLDPRALVAAADDPAWRGRVEASRARAGALGLFGVPTFVWRDRRFWGNDRLDWLLRGLREARGLPVPDLAGDPLAPPVEL